MEPIEHFKCRVGVTHLEDSLFQSFYVQNLKVDKLRAFCSRELIDFLNQNGGSSFFRSGEVSGTITSQDLQSLAQFVEQCTSHEDALLNQIGGANELSPGAKKLLLSFLEKKSEKGSQLKDLERELRVYKLGRQAIDYLREYHLTKVTLELEADADGLSLKPESLKILSTSADEKKASEISQADRKVRMQTHLEIHKLFFKLFPEQREYDKKTLEENYIQQTEETPFENMPEETPEETFKENN